MPQTKKKSSSSRSPKRKAGSGAIPAGKKHSTYVEYAKEAIVDPADRLFALMTERQKKLQSA
jgi:hypothetical protein